MLHFYEGDIFLSDCTFILHQCNCQSNMGSGIAKQVANLYPEAVEIDKKVPLSPKERLGCYSYAKSEKEDRYIINLYGQLYYGNAKKTGKVYTIENALKSAINHFLKDIERINKNNTPVKIGLPYLMGCDLAGGNWDNVLNMLEKFSEIYKVDFHIYRLQK